MPKPITTKANFYAGRQWPCRVLQVIAVALTACLLLACQHRATAQAALTPLAQEIKNIDAQTPGQLGVYVKNINTGEELQLNAERLWYIASLVKVPVAIAVLQAAEERQLTLEHSVTLAQSDYVDGNGELLYRDPGARFSIGELVQHSIENSDSTATDLLMRTLGVETVNRRVKNMVSDGIQPFTTILQVRYDAYGELHSAAHTLSNMDYVKIRSAGEPSERLDAFASKLGLDKTQLAHAELEFAFERYYQRHLNSATLPALGRLLERLVQGQLLNPENTRRLLKHMQNISTGKHRLQAGLPAGTAFAQKTGSQIARACNMGITQPELLEEALIIVACAENFDDVDQAEKAFSQIAEAISRSAI